MRTDSGEFELIGDSVFRVPSSPEQATTQPPTQQATAQQTAGVLDSREQFYLQVLAQERARADAAIAAATAAITAKEAQTIKEESIADLAKELNLKTLFTPTELRRDEDFAEWKLDFENMLLPLSVEKLLAYAVDMDEDPRLDEMTDRNKLIGKFLYMLLTNLVRNNSRANSVVRSVHDLNGWKAWRRLCSEYQPRTSDRWLAVETALLTPRWTSHRFLDQLREWTEDVYKYEHDNGRQIPDHTRVSVVVRWAPPEIRTYIRSAPESVTTNF